MLITSRFLLGIVSSLFTISLIAGCKPDHDYKIIAEKNYFDQTQNLGSGGQMIEYMLSHEDNTIRARCQAWDIKNDCKLEVGKEYDFVRERGIAGFDTLCLYDPHDKNQPKHATTILAVEEESTH